MSYTCAQVSAALRSLRACGASMWLLVRLAANAAGQPILVPSTARNPHPGHDPTTPTDAPGSLHHARYCVLNASLSSK